MSSPVMGNFKGQLLIWSISPLRKQLKSCLMVESIWRVLIAALSFLMQGGFGKPSKLSNGQLEIFSVYIKIVRRIKQSNALNSNMFTCKNKTMTNVSAVILPFTPGHRWLSFVLNRVQIWYKPKNRNSSFSQETSVFCKSLHWFGYSWLSEIF